MTILLNQSQRHPYGQTFKIIFFYQLTLCGWPNYRAPAVHATGLLRRKTQTTTGKWKGSLSFTASFNALALSLSLLSSPSFINSFLNLQENPRFSISPFVSDSIDIWIAQNPQIFRQIFSKFLVFLCKIDWETSNPSFYFPSCIRSGSVFITSPRISGFYFSIFFLMCFWSDC